MPSALVNRYEVYVDLGDATAARRAIGREPSFMMAVESCLAAYGATGHFGYVIADQKAPRMFRFDRMLLLQVLFLKTHDRVRYFEILNRLDRGGSQAELDSFLTEHARI